MIVCFACGEPPSRESSAGTVRYCRCAGFVVYLPVLPTDTTILYFGCHHGGTSIQISPFGTPITYQDGAWLKDNPVSETLEHIRQSLAVEKVLLS